MRLRELQTHLYLLEGQRPPHEAPDDWYDPSSPTYVRDCPRDEDALESFLVGCEGVYTSVYINVNEDSTAEEIQAIFYDWAKKAFGEDKSSIREFFKLLYLVIFQRDSGPRWGEFIKIIGKDKFLDTFRARMSNVLDLPT